MAEVMRDGLERVIRHMKQKAHGNRSQAVIEKTKSRPTRDGPSPCEVG